MPAPAVIPAPVAYAKIVAVKKLVVGNGDLGASSADRDFRSLFFSLGGGFGRDFLGWPIRLLFWFFWALPFPVFGYNKKDWGERVFEKGFGIWEDLFSLFPLFLIFQVNLILFPRGFNYGRFTLKKLERSMQA